ncbi:MAG: S8 family serine peptidase [Oligoflexia bacterium]|nr:S8 family serine peptidase [Oligoflexia bacterium]
MMLKLNVTTVRMFMSCLLMLLFVFFVYGCSKDLLKSKDQNSTNTISISQSEIDKIKECGVVSGSDLSKITALSKNSSSSSSKDNFMILVNSNTNTNTLELAKKIVDNGGEIIFQDDRLGYIHFNYPTQLAFNLLSSELKSIKNFMISKKMVYKPYKIKENELRKLESDILKLKKLERQNKIIKDSRRTNIYSTEMMKVPELKKYFKDKYNQELDGSSVTVVVADTGLDIARTDAFQDRIIGLRSLRMVDGALITKAEVKEIDGEKYLWAKINGLEVKILKSKRLSDESNSNRDYYIGYFSEKQYSILKDDHTNYDFNQDGKDSAIFPIVVFKNNEGIFQAYINVNDKLTYKEKGDNSIEDENVLYDFNSTSTSTTNRFVKDEKHPSLSYYRYTTRLDIINNKNVNPSSVELITDRNKGVMNMALNMEAGYELTAKGDNFKVVGMSVEGKELYRVGLAGFDTHGHGTFCAGLAAGNFETASEFNSGASKAKIVGLTFLGGGGDSAEFADTLIKTIQKYPNVVFSFSFGSNDSNNDTQSEMSKVYDEIARTYQAVFVKAAGNEGPGVKSHGTTVANHVISVANYYSTNSRETHGTGNFQNNKFFIENSSSRGPTVDGALKPDIGSPGWAVGVRTFSRLLGSDKNGSFQYWSGTSMAAPNLAGVIALLYDGAVKAKLINEEMNASTNTNTAVTYPYPPIALDKIFTALKNSALEYDPQLVTVGSTLKSNMQKPAWIEGGAGRVNAVGAFEIIEKIYNEPIHFYSTETPSLINGYTGITAVGYFAIDRLPQTIDFVVKFDQKNELINMTDHQSFTLRIPEENDWLSFDAKENIKERYIDLFAAEKVFVRLYVRTEKLMQNNRLKSGLHTAVIKAFNAKRGAGINGSELFDFAFPITIIGYDTMFDPIIDKDHFAAKGFIPVGHFARFFLPISKDQDALLTDLIVTDNNPGDVSMTVYYKGLEVPFKEFQAPAMWALSSSIYGEGRNRLRYTFSDRPAGLYEVILQADVNAAYDFNGVDGSYYELQSSRLSLTVPKYYFTSDGESIEVVLENAKNSGSYLRINSAEVALTALRHKENLKIKDKESLQIPITVHPATGELIINTKYVGIIEKMDIDIRLLNEKGEEVGSSGSPTADEIIRLILPVSNGSGSGGSGGNEKYTLIIEGFSIPTETKETSFLLTIKQNLRAAVLLSDSFVGASKDIILKNNFRWEHDREYNFKARFKNSILNSGVAPQMDRYEQVISATVKAMSGNAGESVLIFNRELN